MWPEVPWVNQSWLSLGLGVQGPSRVIAGPAGQPGAREASGGLSPDASAPLRARRGPAGRAAESGVRRIRLAGLWSRPRVSPLCPQPVESTLKILLFFWTKI